MFELFMKVEPILDGLSHLVLGVVIVATVVARLTPSPKDDEVIGNIRKAILTSLKFLPTLGMNPQTKKLEEAVKDMKK